MVVNYQKPAIFQLFQIKLVNTFSIRTKFLSCIFLTSKSVIKFSLFFLVKLHIFCKEHNGDVKKTNYVCFLNMT